MLNCIDDRELCANRENGMNCCSILFGSLLPLRVRIKLIQEYVLQRVLVSLVILKAVMMACLMGLVVVKSVLIEKMV